MRENNKGLKHKKMNGPFEKYESPLRKVESSLKIRSRSRRAILANIKYNYVNHVDE